MLIKEAVDEEHGIKINGRQSQRLDTRTTAVVAPTQDILQRMMDKISLACKNYGMKLYVKKTKVMILKKGNEK